MDSGDGSVEDDSGSDDAIVVQIGRGTAAQLDLNAALAGLARIVTGATSLGGLLEQVAGFAVAAIPGAEGVGVTLLEPGRVDTLVASEDFVRAVDDLQYSLMEGPCVSAAAEGRTVRSGSLADDPLWPRFGPRVAGLGVHSALSLPLILAGEVVGALNVYAHGQDVFDADAEQLGELFAGPAAVAVHNAQILSQAETLVEQLRTALSTRAVIDQAIGITMSRDGVTAEEAIASLRLVSQVRNVKLNVLAQQIVAEAVHRFRHKPTRD